MYVHVYIYIYIYVHIYMASTATMWPKPWKLLRVGPRLDFPGPTYQGGNRGTADFRDSRVHTERPHPQKSCLINRI